MENHLVYIGLGTNIAPRLERMQEAINALANMWKVHATSSIYCSKPVGYTDQAEFLNAVVALQCKEQPLELFRQLKILENTLGRVARDKWHEREIDFDILFYDNLIYHDDQLNIPHQEALHRNFVVIPLIEIAPSLVDPSSGKPIATFLQQVGLDPNSIRMLSVDECID